MIEVNGCQTSTEPGGRIFNVGSVLRGFFLLTLAVMLILPLSATRALATHINGTERVLTGELRISMVKGDSTEKPPANSPDWQTLSLEVSGLSSVLPHTAGVAWIELFFDLKDPDFYTNPSLLVTQPGDADEIYLNGKRIGGEGLIAPNYVTVPPGPRYLEIPPGLLKSGRNNLSFKVLFAEYNYKNFDGRIILGDDHSIFSLWSLKQNKYLISEAVYLSFYLTALLVFITLFAKNTNQTGYLFFIIFLLGRTLAIYLGSHFGEAHLSNMAWTTTARRVLTPFTSAAMTTLVVFFQRRRAGNLYWLVMAGLFAFILLELFIKPMESLTNLGVPYKILSILDAVYILFVASSALFSGLNESLPLFIGTVCFAAGSRLDLFFGTEVRDYSIVIFTICMFYAIASRHNRLAERLKVLSGKLIDAHEHERHRLARDIHDGVGQSLLSLKVRMQLLNAKVAKGETTPKETFDELIKRTNDIIGEVRRTSLDLRPSHIEKMSLPEMLKWYASSLTQDLPLELVFHISGGDFKDPAPRIKDNFFRIFQEVLSNAVKHSKAQRLEISLFTTPGFMVMTATDNGIGFELPRKASKQGMGLATMTERAELLGGTIEIKSRPGQGTTINVEVPL